MNKIRRQSGVLVFLTPFLMVALAVVAVLAMDAARLYSVKADMQRVVNAAATAAADSSQACSMDADFSEMKSRALTAAKAVGFSGDESELEVFFGILVPSDEDSAVLEFERRAAIQETNAAHVTYTRNEPLTKLPIGKLLPGIAKPIRLEASAASRKELYAVLSGGSSTVEINEGLLGALLGELLEQKPYSLDPTDVTSLQTTLVSVGDLLAGLGVSDLTSFADEPLIDLLDELIDVLDKDDEVTPSVLGLIEGLRNSVHIDGLNVEGALQIRGDRESAMSARFPLYDFIISVVMNMVANLDDDEHGRLLPIELGVLESESPLVSGLKSVAPIFSEMNVSLDIYVGNPAPVVVGPAMKDSGDEWVTSLESSDVLVAAMVELTLDKGPLDGLLGLLEGISGVDISKLGNLKVPIVASTGSSSAQFTGSECARPRTGDIGFNEVELRVEVVENALAKVVTGTLDAESGEVVGEPIKASLLSAEITLLNLLKLAELDLCVSAELSTSLGEDTSEDVSGVKPPLESAYPLHCTEGRCTSTFEKIGVDGLGSLNLDVTNVQVFECDGDEPSVLGTVVGGLLLPVTELLSEVTGRLGQHLIKPLFDMLGVQLGSLNLSVIGADQLGHQLIEGVEIKSVGDSGPET